ncbi:MAG: hypothetical protein ABI212_02025 [Burkholderiaceae bacterium]
MNQQDKSTDSAPEKRPQPKLQSTRGTGDVLGGYRAPGDAKHQAKSPTPPHGAAQGSSAADERAEEALDHDRDYGKWGGKSADEGTTPGGSAQLPADKGDAARGGQKGRLAGQAVEGEPDLGPPPGHYGDAEMGGQGDGSKPGAKR